MPWRVRLPMRFKRQLRHVIAHGHRVGGAILSDSVKQDLQELMPEAMVLNNFGATETGHQGTSFEDSASGRPTFAMHDGNVVLDEEHNPIEPGSDQVGFLARRGRLLWAITTTPRRRRVHLLRYVASAGSSGDMASKKMVRSPFMDGARVASIRAARGLSRRGRRGP